MECKPAAVSPLVIGFLSLGVWGGLAVWSIIVSRLHRGRPVLRVEPRRSVPWGGLDLLAVYAVYVLTALAVHGLAIASLGAEACKPIAVGEAGRIHPIIQLFSRANWPTMLACVAAAVFLAPIVEEVLFRLFLQGWLERLDRRLRPEMPTIGRFVRFGTLPVLLSTFLFAMLHFRVDAPSYKPDFLTFMLIARGAASLVTVAAALVLVRGVRGATLADLGWRSEKVLADVGLGLAAFLAVAVPIYALQLGLMLALPSYLAPDPLTLFFFALVLGALYLRTHRIVPSIVAHMALNATSMFLAYWS